MILYNFLKVVLSIIFRIFFRIKVINRPKIAKDQSLVICANHISILDPIVLAITFNRHINYMAKKELFDNKFLGWFLRTLGAFPIDRDKLDMKSVRYSMSLLKEGKVLGIFPEGTRVKTVDIENIKEGIGLMASRTNSDILPVYIETEYKLFRPIKIYYRPMIEMENYKEMDKKTRTHEITKDTYKSIYNLEEINGDKNSR